MVSDRTRKSTDIYTGLTRETGVTFDTFTVPSRGAMHLWEFDRVRRVVAHDAVRIPIKDPTTLCYQVRAIVAEQPTANCSTKELRIF